MKFASNRTCVQVLTLTVILILAWLYWLLVSGLYSMMTNVTVPENIFPATTIVELSPDTTTTIPPTTTTALEEPLHRANVSWYGPGLYGNGTACGHKYTNEIQGVAHKSLPCGTKVTFRHNGVEVTVPVIDRGPYVRGRMWDLSAATCRALDHCFTGSIEYKVAS